MPYTPKVWHDLPNTTTPITADELNRIEAGVDDAVDFADTHPGASDPHTEYQKESEKGAAGGYASLDGSGKIPSAQLPDIAISDYLGVAANQAAMLALTGQKGDWCVRSDENKVYVITGADPTIIGGWTALAYPADAVVSVNGEAGVVSLSAVDVGAEPVGAVATHSSDTTSVHGIANTADLVVTTDARLSDARTPTAHAHDASAISVDAAGFNGNLAPTDDTVQKVAQRVDDLTVGGGGATVSSGIAAPSGGSDGDWYLRRTTGHWSEKVSGTWTLRDAYSAAPNIAAAAAAGSNYASAGGWIAGAGYFSFYGSTAQTQTLFSSKTGSPTFSNMSITVAGASLGAANAKASLKGVREAYALFTVDTMPSAGRNLYVGIGMDFTYPYCYIGISNAGVATLYTGGGGAVKTLSGTVAAGDYVNFKLVNGALLVAITSSAYALRDQVLFASELVSAAYLEAQGVQVLVGGDGKATLFILEVHP